MAYTDRSTRPTALIVGRVLRIPGLWLNKRDSPPGSRCGLAARAAYSRLSDHLRGMLFSAASSPGRLPHRPPNKNPADRLHKRSAGLFWIGFLVDGGPSAGRSLRVHGLAAHISDRRSGRPSRPLPILRMDPTNQLLRRIRSQQLFVGIGGHHQAEPPAVHHHPAGELRRRSIYGAGLPYAVQIDVVL